MFIESDNEIRWREQEHNLKSVDMMSIAERNLWNFGYMSSKVLTAFCPWITWTLSSYGCFCGSNYWDWPPTSNMTMDEFDAICLYHDWCYQEAEGLEECSGYSTTYNYDINSSTHVAYCTTSSNNKCQEVVCQCDVKFTDSMRQLIKNPNGAHNCPNTNPGCQQP